MSPTDMLLILWDDVFQKSPKGLVEGMVDH